MRIFSQIVMICLGIYRFQIIDHTSSRPTSKQPRDLPYFTWDQQLPLVGPHMSLLDILGAGGFLGTPSFLSKAELAKVGMVSFLLKAYRCILVTREFDEKVDTKVLKEAFPMFDPNKTAGQHLRERIESPLPGFFLFFLFLHSISHIPLLSHNSFLPSPYCLSPHR